MRGSARTARSLVRIGWTVSLAVVTTMAAGQNGTPTAAPPPPDTAQLPTFRADTTIVPLDVRVIDRRGRPVTDLTAADFTITEDGVPQRLLHFSTQALTPLPEASIDRGPVRLRNEKPTTIAPATSRTFLIVLGRGDMDGPSFGIDGIIHLVRDRLLPQDRVAILAWNRSTSFTTDHASALAVLTRFKSGFRKVERELSDYLRSPVYFYGDRTIMPAYIQRDIDRIFEGPERAPMRTNVAQLQLSSSMDDRIREMYDALSASDTSPTASALADRMGLSLEDFFSDLGSTLDDSNNLYGGIEYLRHMDGEKHLVWLTDVGFRLVGVDVPAEFERDIARTAADGRVVLDIIRAGGVEFASPMAAANRRAPASGRGPTMGGSSIWPAAASRALAELTGGRSDANKYANAAAAIDAVDQASRFQYLLGYTPSNETWDGRFRSIRVTVNRPGVEVFVRRGYFARQELGPLDRRGVLTHTRICAAAGDAREISDLAVRAHARDSGATDARSVTIEALLDLSRVSFEPMEGLRHAEIEVHAFALDAHQHPVGDARVVVALDYTAARLEDARAAGAPITLVVPVSAKADSVKLVAYDFVDDLTGSVNLEVADTPR